MSANHTAIGIGALLVGGLIGGLIGGTLASRGAGTGAPVGAVPSGTTDGGTQADAALLRALADLTTEVRGMRADLSGSSNERPSERVTPDGGTPELERLAELLDVLATNLKTGPLSGTSPGYQGQPLVVPAGEPRRDRLADLADLPEAERSNELRFLTYQQILDRLGRPDYVTDAGIWIYVDPLSGIELTIHYKDGLVTNVY